jgi:sugar transferase (PEP-CTERM/EpsH1 system associated)
MRIGVLLSRVPYPLEKGDKLRAFHQIKELSRRHKIYLCAINVGKVNKEDIAKIAPYCEEIKIIHLNKFNILLNLLKGLFLSHLPLQVAYFFKKKAKQEVTNFFNEKQVEHIYCQLIRVSEYVKDIHATPKTLDYMDALSRGMERRIDKSSFYLKPFVKLETKRLKRYEHFIFSSFEHHTIISEQDQSLIVHPLNQEITIVRNGVDQHFFHPIEKEKQYDLVFTGNMSYPPNVDGVCFLVEQILPLLPESINLAIVGATPSPRVQKLASQQVHVTGWVEDIRDYYASSRIFIAPMQIGTGLQNKLLEAMAMRMPCITSPLANNALRATNNKEIIIADSVEEYAQAILNLLDNKEKAQQIAENALRFISTNYDWQSSTAQLEALFLGSSKQQ